MQEEFLSKGLTICDKVFVDSLLRGEDVHHGDFSNSLEFVNVNTQVRSIKDILDDGLQRFSNRLGLLIELGCVVTWLREVSNISRVFLKVLGISGPMNTNFLPFCLILGFNKLIILCADR